MATIKFSRQEFENCLSSTRLHWEPYQYQYARSINAGELAYAVPVNRWCRVVVYSTVHPPSQKNLEGGVSETSRDAGQDAIRFVLEYQNQHGAIKAVGGYPRIYRRRANSKVLFFDVAWVVTKLHGIARAGMKYRCPCGRARPPRYKAHDPKKKVTSEEHWFLGGCLEYGVCEATGGKNVAASQPKQPAGGP